jgi:predicted RNA methylase
VSRRYLLDANAFIEAKNRYYGFDICPGFWSSLIVQNAAKRIFSIDRIETELKEQDDEVKEWVLKLAPEGFFKKTEDQAVIDKFQEMVNWVYPQPQYTDAAKSEFASVADGWVLAYAATNGLVVVTHEQFAPDAKRTVPIPNVCVEFEIEYVNTFEMLRELGEKFVRRKKHLRMRHKT